MLYKQQEIEVIQHKEGSCRKYVAGRIGLNVDDYISKLSWTAKDIEKTTKLMAVLFGRPNEDKIIWSDDPLFAKISNIVQNH